MKRNFLLLLAILAAFIVACKPEEPEVLDPVLTLIDTEVTITATGGEGEIEYTLENPVDGEMLEAKASVEWITNFDYSTSGLIKFNVDQSFEDARSATITIGYINIESQDVTVNQQAAGNSLDLSSENLSYVQAGGKLEIDITSDRAWSLSTVPSWLEANMTSGPAGESTLSLTATANESDDVRNGKLTVTSGSTEVDITASQGFTGRIVVERATYDVPWEYTELEIKITTSKEARMEFAEEYDWIRPIATRGMNEQKFNIEVDPNLAYEERSAVVIFSNGDAQEQVTIIQEKSIPTEYTQLIPDASLKLKLIGLCDKDGDMLISHDEAMALTKIVDQSYEWYPAPMDFTGLEYFTNLEKIDVIGLYGTKEITLKNPKLTYFNFSYNPSVEKVDVTGCPELLDINISSTAVTYLDVTTLTKLEKLNCGHADMETINTGNNTALQELVIHAKKFNTLDISKNTNLTKLNITSDSLKTISIAENTKLKELKLTCPEISTIDLSSNTKLLTLALDNSIYGSVDVSKLLELRSLSIKNNLEMTSLDISNNLSLGTLNLTGSTNIASLIMTEGQVIGSKYGFDESIITYEDIVYPDNYAEKITDSKLLAYMLDEFDTDKSGTISKEEAEAVTIIDAQDKDIKEFTGLYFFKNITSINLSNNPLVSLNVDFFPLLSKLIVNNTDLSYVALDKITGLTHLEITNSKLTTMTSTENHKGLEYVDLSNNQISGSGYKVLSFTGLTNLAYIDLSNNQISGYGVPELYACTALEYVNLSDNNYFSFNFGMLSAAKEVYFNNNDAWAVSDLNKIPNLEIFEAANNPRYKQLDFSKNDNIQRIYAPDCGSLTKVILKEGVNPDNLDITIPDAAVIEFKM